jgi:signal peptidase I
MEEENKAKRTPLIKARKPWAAFFLSLLIPGLGHLYLGNPKKAAFIYFSFYLIFYLGIFICGVLYSNGIIFLLFIVLGALVQLIFIPILSYSKAKKIPVEYKLRKYNRWYVYLIIVFVDIFLLNNVLPIDIGTYKITTGSMEFTLLAGDRIIVDRSAYGGRSLLYDLFSKQSANPKRGDLVVYNQYTYNDAIDLSHKTPYIKRCAGIPGDTIQIVNRVLYVNSRIFPDPGTVRYGPKTMTRDISEPRIFPKGSGWNEDYYGPLVVPNSGMIIRIDSANFDIWKVFILRENADLNQDQSKDLLAKVMQDGYYKVKEDYLFLLGDYRNNSLDSRYIGFISVKDVTGKVLFVYFSNNPVAGILWNRMGLNVK